MIFTGIGCYRGRASALCLTIGILCGCSPPSTPSSQRPVASIQELMQGIVDPSADGVWNAVEIIETRTGSEMHQPRTPEDWLEARHAAITLVESTNLLVLEGRQVGARAFGAEAAGALGSSDIQKLDQRQEEAAFSGFARCLARGGSDRDFSHRCQGPCIVDPSRRGDRSGL